MLEIPDVPSKWANDDIIKERDRLAMALLRIAGCRCELPLLGLSVRWPEGKDEPECPGGPRCRTCNIQVFLEEPSESLVKHRRWVAHMVAKKQATLMPSLKEIGLGECYEGCGCS